MPNDAGRCCFRARIKHDVFERVPYDVSVWQERERLDVSDDLTCHLYAQAFAENGWNIAGEINHGGEVVTVG